MASTSSSHPQNAFSGIEPPNKRRRIEESSRVHDVFINHRGPDVKHTLAAQLYKSLKDLHIKPFLDSEEEELGDSFPSTIETAIRSARVHIAIFSPRYAESPWCLAELVLMLQSTAKIIPVFYEVKPSDLRHIEAGVYAEAFNIYEQKGRYLEKLNMWKEALEQVSYTAGYEFKTSDLGDCKDIVSAVEKEVRRKNPLPVAKYPVGLYKLVKDFERRCLDELVKDFESQCGMKKAAKGKANVVGIFGMGGVGKTTLSLELFNQKISEYTSASFLYDVREAYARGALPLLQSQLVKDIFSEGNRSFSSNKEGTSYLRDLLERSSSLSFLIVLDDIDHVEQLEALLPMDILNKHGNGNHLVIVTTRDVGVLVSAEIDIAYHLRGLHRQDGRELFCWHAFKKSLPLGGFEDLVEGFVNVCGGLPLSLIVLGRHVSRRPRRYWQGQLEKVRKALPGDVRKNLKISFDALDNEEKQIFMDIACFYIDMSVTQAMSIWQGSGWRTRHALETLKEKCLVEEVELNHLNQVVEKWESSPNRSVLRMHDHLRDLGREMADEQSYPRRVWSPRDLKSLESKGFLNILTQTKGRCFHSFLDNDMGCEITYLLGELEDSSESSLLWLQLEYQSQHLPNLNLESSLPSWIPLQKLQCLRISNGCFRKLWESDVQAPSHLKELQIQNTFVEEFPDFLGKLDNMKKLDLHAKDIQTDIWSLFEPLRMNVRSLKMRDRLLIGDLVDNDTADTATFNSLVIYDFERLWEGEVVLNNEGTVMSKVEDLEIQGCSLVMRILINGSCCQCLQSLKLSELKNLIEVDLSRIKTLKTLDIRSCEKFATLDISCLEKFTIENCNNVKSVLGQSNLPKLVELNIIQCLGFEELSLAHLSCLKIITIKNCNHLKSVAGISDLAKLVELEISGCHMLEDKELRLAHLSSLEKISIQNFNYLKRVSGIFNLVKLVELKIYGCDMLELEELRVAQLSCLKKITIGNCNHLKNVSGLSNLTNLVELEISGCQMLVFKFLCLNDMKHLKRIAVDRNVNMECFELDSCKNLRTVMIGCKNIVQLSIRNCAELEKLENLIGPSCLKRIIIDGCGKLKYISLKGLENLEILSGNMELRQLDINQLPALEELPSLARLSCLQTIQILLCEKLRTIKLPPTLLSLWVESCRDLQSIEGIADLTKLTSLVIDQCPALEELPSLARLSCLETIQILFCEKLRTIKLPPILLSVWVKSCRDLQSIEGIADLTKLTSLVIYQCPALEELPSLARLSCLQTIEIFFCEKLRTIKLPPTLLWVWVRSCRDLQSIEGIADLTKLLSLVIYQCPALEELPSLAKLSCLEEIQIGSCEKLESIAGVEELQVLAHVHLSYYSNALIRNCIHKLKCIPSERMIMIGGAVHGAESILNENLFVDANIGVDGVIEIGTHETHCVGSLWSTIIECYVVTSDSSEEDINIPLTNFPFNKVCEGEWIITGTVWNALRDKSNDPMEDVLRRYRIMKGFAVEMKIGERGKCVDVLRTIVDRLHHL